MFNLFIFALVPIFFILIYIFFQDLYEKEPKKLALKGTFLGFLISFPILVTELFLQNLIHFKHSLTNILFDSFVVASFVEESYKYIVLYILIWKNKNFNEPFDGILYSIFVSMGFALIENIFYIFSPQFGGYKTAFLRAIFSVPAHAFFGVFMGFYLSINKFIKSKHYFFYCAIFIPFILHGFYDFLLSKKFIFSDLFFLLLYIFMLIQSFFKIFIFLKISPFKKH